MKLYKLTNAQGQTMHKTQWGPGVTHTATGEGDLCGPGWLHAYTHPVLAVLMNPIHANILNPRLWEAEGVIGKSDNGLKVGTTRLTTLREIPLPVVTAEQRMRFAIAMAWPHATKSPNWNKWAVNWLMDIDRSAAAAFAAYAAYADAARATADAAPAYAAYAAYADAARATAAAAYAAYAAYADAARATADAAPADAAAAAAAAAYAYAAYADAAAAAAAYADATHDAAAAAAAAAYAAADARRLIIAAEWAITTEVNVP